MRLQDMFQPLYAIVLLQAYNRMKYLLVLLILSIALAQNSEPVPSCHPNLAGFKDIPVAVGEYQTYDIDAFFTGFNLEFNLSSEAPSFVHLTDKLETLATSKDPLVGIKSYHIEPANNSWGQQFIILTESNFTSTVKWGRMAALDALPVIQGSVVVETQVNVDCFDAIRFAQEGVIMVDCASKSGNNETGYVYRNRFLYVNTTSQKVMSNVVSNKLYVDFRFIHHRRFFRLTEDGYHYLVRVNYAAAVDVKNRQNTYIEIFTANNPLKPYILRVIDRSFLGLKKLSITDFKVYLGDLYLLDYHTGVVKFDITPSQQIVIVGKYETSVGFQKFGVYSDDLHREFLLALANNHAVYEVDWTNQIKPRLITKYSLMSGSRVDSVHVNNFYVVVQAEANVTHNGSSFYTPYNTTWVFTRNSRTYSHAYVAIMHDSANTLIAFNMEHSIILSMDEEGLDLYRLNKPYLGIFPQDNSTLNKEYIFSVIAKSVNHVTHQNLSCSFTWRSYVVTPDNYDLWETGFTPSPVYYSNYPGGLEINLANYVIGPNITYGLEEESVDGDLPEYIILQQNKSEFVWSKPMNIGNITFLRTEQYESTDNQTLFIYLQDSNKNFFVHECVSSAISAIVNCTQLYRAQMNGTILNLTANRFHYYSGIYRHLVAVTTTSSPYSVHIHNMDTGESFNNIHLIPGYTGQVTSIEFLGEFLTITCKYAKAIYFYDMIRCEDHGRCDRPIFEIDTNVMHSVGIHYFAPLQVIISDFHPYILFIQNMESVIIIDFSPTGIKLLEHLNSTATRELGYYGWRMAVNRNHLVLVNAPDIIEEWSLDFLYQRRVVQTRTYPLYNYTIPETFDMDFSDAGDLVYITAQEKRTGEGKVLVYRAGYPTVMTFYDVYDMNASYSETLIDATGVFCDFLVLASGSRLQVFRQFMIPLLIIYDTFSDFSFNITYKNTDKIYRLPKSTVKIANYPIDIKINNTQLKNQTYLDSLIDYNDDHRYYTIRDEDWFNGTVLNFTITCESECGEGGKIVLVDHVHLRRSVPAYEGMWDYHFTARGGVIQHGQSLMRMLHNGSVQDYVSMPTQGNGEACKRVTVDFFHDFFVSACQESDTDILLYLTSENGYKPFTMGPFPSSADAIANLQIMGNLLFLTDSDAEFHYIRRQGGVIVYRINHNGEQTEAFDELQVLDSNDFLDTKGWEEEKAYIGNSHVVWTNDTSLFRLLVTEVRYGLFLVDFKWANGRDELTIVKTNFINIKELLGNISYPLPNDAHFAAVSVLNEVYNGPSEYWLLDVVVSIRGFHSVELNILVDKSGTVLESRITKLYQRYAYYQSTNYLKAFDGYFSVVQMLPSFLHNMVNYSRQIIAVYDARPNRTNPQYLEINGKASDIELVRMMGGLAIPDFGQVAFDYNFTIRRNESDPFSNISLVVIDPLGSDIKEVSIHESLHLITHPGISSTQNVKLIARNDWSKVELPFSIVIPGSGLPWWGILLIVLGSVGVAAAAGYYGWTYWKAKKAAAAGEGDAHKSLLEREAQEEEQSDEEDEGEETKEKPTLVEPTNENLNDNVEPAPVSVPVPLPAVKPEERAAEVVVPPNVESVDIPAPIENPQSRSGAINESVQEDQP